LTQTNTLQTNSSIYSPIIDRFLKFFYSPAHSQGVVG